MKIDFNVKYFSGLYGSLNIQIIPSTLIDNPGFLNSIVIDEIAFSLVEKIFMKNEHKYAHWGNTYIESKKIENILDELCVFYNFLKSKEQISNQDVKLIFEEETNFFISNYSLLKKDSLDMILKVINFLENIKVNNIDGITIVGV